jgi:phosphohistidine phosphatase
MQANTSGMELAILKNLLLLRHGKSDWGASFATDHDRPLATRGEAAAKLIGTFLARVGPLPDLILSSSAVRALTTAQLAKKSGRWSSQVLSNRSLYGAGPEFILELIKQQDDAVKTLMVVGHNPTWELMAHLLIGGGNLRFPTGALARIKLPCHSWREIAFGQGTLSWLVTPKQLKKLTTEN